MRVYNFEPGLVCMPYANAPQLCVPPIPEQGDIWPMEMIPGFRIAGQKILRAMKRGTDEARGGRRALLEGRERS